MSVEVFVPANFVSAGWGTPTVCARHGEPAVETKRIQFVSRTSPWLFLAGLIIYFIVAAATRKTVSAPAWPFCGQCKKEQTTKTAVGWVSVVLGLPIWVISAQLPHGVAPIGALIGIVLFIGGFVVVGRGSRLAIAGGVVTNDGTAVRFAKAHEAFASQAAAAQQAAAQHYAAQQPYPAQPYPAQPFSAQPYPAQPYPAQPFSGQPGPGQPGPGQPGPGQPYPAQPGPGQAVADAYPKEQPPAAV